MSTRVTRSKSKQPQGEASGEQSQQQSSAATASKRTANGRKRKKSSNTADEERAESEPTLQLETTDGGDKTAGQQLKLVAADGQQQDDAGKHTETQREDGSRAQNESKDGERNGDGSVEGWQDGHDSDTDYHEPQSPTQLLTLEQTDHRTAASSTPPSLPDDIDLSPVIINRAPVLTLWAAVLAHLGPAKLPWLSSLTVGKAVAAMLAQSRGRSLGLFEPSADRGRKRQKTPEEKEREEADVQVLGIKVHIARVDGHVYATISNKPVNAPQCDRYVHQHFGANRPRVIAVMKYLTHCILARGADGEADVTGRYSFTVYEQIRPTLANGQAPGWGQKGELDLKKMVLIAKNELESAKTEGIQLHLTTNYEMQNGAEQTELE